MTQFWRLPAAVSRYLKSPLPAPCPAITWKGKFEAADLFLTFTPTPAVFRLTEGEPAPRRLGHLAHPAATLESVLVTIASQPERPKWLRAPAPVGKNYRELKELVTRLRLHTVCESAACPNVGECWNHRTATFMILGNVCTRRCGFCAVQKGAPLEVDYDEPRRVAEACQALGLRYAVITSVNRDDRKDGGAELFALTIEAIRQRLPQCRVEVLIPDFQGSHAAVECVIDARPDVLSHNTETVPRLYRQVQAGRAV